MKDRLSFAAIVAIASFSFFLGVNPQTVSAGAASSSNQLQIIDKSGNVTGFVPLKHTGIKTEISGFVARTEVTQEFENVLPDTIEAIYVFPLPHESAVDGMTMTVGEREIRAVIKEREEARKIFEAARNSGHTAALLDQERPNIFTQSVTNIPAGGRVEIKLSVIELLKYEAGVYEFSFPLVVGPRYIPGNPTSAGDHGTMPNTDQVPDASHISPPVAGVDTADRHAGHDVSLEVNLTAGVPLGDVKSPSHKIFADRTGADSYHIQLARDSVLPDKDFILKYKVAGAQIQDAVLSHSDKSGGYFTLILQPPERPAETSLVPRQMIFVLDTSGSMWGYPIEMAKKTIQRALDNLRKDETFNLITFSGDTRVLFPEPVPATAENVALAKSVLAGAYGSGGTEMMTAIRTALGDDAGKDKPMEADPIRIVCFMTDGYVGNDAEIIAEVKKHPEARVFSFGIGKAVNRFLLAKMAEEGHGDVEFVTAPSETQAAADRFYERVHSPVLTNISIDWNGLPVTDVYPREVRDLFSAKPIILTGRFTGNPSGKITIKGYQGTGDYSRTIPVDFTSAGSGNAVLEKIWARSKVEDLMSQDWSGIQNGNSSHKAQIIEVGLKHSLATQYTSFVAVEERTVVSDGKPVRVEVPIQLPKGVSPLAVPSAGIEGKIGGVYKKFAPAAPPPPPGYASNETVEVTAQVSTFDVVSTTTKQKDASLKRAESKMSPKLLAMYHCSVSRGVRAAGNQCKATPGEVKVTIDLTETKTGLEQRLRRLGLKVTGGTGTTQLSGTIALAKLGKLAELAEVKSIALNK
jgi:Ca-activated chloride channel family protein